MNTPGVVALRDVELTILKCVHDRKSIREMAALIGKSVGTVQAHLRKLEALGLVINPPGDLGETIARGRQVTREGMDVLRSNRLT